MAINEIAMDTAVLQNDIQTIETSLTGVRNKTENMFTNMKALDTMWDGIANQTFMAQFTNDYNSMKELCDTINTILENIKTAKKEYEQCESSINTVIKDIQIESN